MIAITFLLRIAKFLLAVIIIGGGVAVVWFVLLYSFKLMIDGIEYSNREFFIWLKEKFPFKQIIARRNRKKEEVEYSKKMKELNNG
jgi:hypothetical protein